MDNQIQSAYQEELLRLEEAGAIINRQLERLRAVPRYTGHDFTEQVLESLREEARTKLAIAQPEPYFGRLDFQENGKEQPVPLYIGKAGVDREDSGQPLVIDWRAPVASLFYSFTGGEGPAEYESPDGLIEGLVYLKRNLVIRKQILQRVTDTYARGSGQEGVSDEFLLYRLGENKDNKLRDIVSTIQAEQDKIIRAAKNKALVIQGVAGSGKTTVALHRLAFLLYQYREQVRAERMIIFAPNRMFLDYISSVLPELGVGDIAQTTFGDWAVERLGGGFKLADEAPELEKRFTPSGPADKGAKGGSASAGEPVPSGRWKGAAALAGRLDAELDRYEQDYLKEQDYLPWDGARLPGKLIRQWFYTDNVHDPLAKRRERVVARIKRWLEMELDKVRDPKIRKDRKKAAAARLKAFLKDWEEPSALAFYRSLFDKTARRSWIPDALADEALKHLKKNAVKAEDLALLMYIHDRFHGIGGNDRFDHIVIDEAQDFSPLQLEVLKRHSRNHSFTILGDLAQGIHDYKGIHSWQEFSSLFDAEETDMFQLNRSYRSTMEIIHFANGVLAHSGVEVAPAVPVFRSGESVTVDRIPKERRREALLEAVHRLQQEQHGTIAVIGRSEADCRSIHEWLAEAGTGARLLTADRQSYEGGLSVLPVYLSKGFEFDAVLVADADAERYPDTPMNAKLLYVACTRALHRLALQHTGEPSPLLAEAPRQ